MFLFKDPQLRRNSYSYHFKKLFGIWLCRTALPNLRGCASNGRIIAPRRRHTRPEHTVAPYRKSKRISFNFMARLEHRITSEILQALTFNQSDEAISHLRRYIALPYHIEFIRLHRLAYIHEFYGEHSKAIEIYERQVRKYLDEDDSHHAQRFTRELVRLEPENTSYREQFADRYLDDGYMRHAVNQLQILKRLYCQRKEFVEAERILKRIVILVDDLKSRNLLEKIVTPPDEFSFDFDNQIDIDLEGIEFSPHT